MASTYLLRRLNSMGDLRALAVLSRTRQPKSVLDATSRGTRFYREAGVFGLRKTKKPPFEDYSEQQNQRRMQNANLVRLTNEFRREGYRAARLDPLGIKPVDVADELRPARFGIPTLGQSFDVRDIISGLDTHPSYPNVPIEDILAHLNRAYSSNVAIEFMHLPDGAQRSWFTRTIETLSRPESQTDREDRLRILQLLTKSEVFDLFMGKRYPNVKRYGLEGSESMMVALDAFFEEMQGAGVTSCIIGMPHRGRLNLLVDLLQLPPRQLFHKLKGNAEYPLDELAAPEPAGDVISHLASSCTLDYKNSSSPLSVSLLHNPSHLEAINPVAMGKARARQLTLEEQMAPGQREACSSGDRVCCLQIHGDGAFSAQGVVTESLGLSGLPHFTSGGSIHIIVNNQIGYTTESANARSTLNASDIGKGIDAPVIRVNGDYPEDVARAARLAYAYRDTFRRDVILDLIVYRRHGHNELDEASFTQPLMYSNIRSRPTVPKLYEQELEQKVPGIGAEQFAKDMREKHEQWLDSENAAAESYRPAQTDAHLAGPLWSSMERSAKALVSPVTGLDEKLLKDIVKASVSYPKGFSIHPRIQKFHVEARLKKCAAAAGEAKLDWSTAETAAFGSLLLQGYHVRISGQDVGRGTFSQRHAMLVDQTTEGILVPLDSLGGNPNLTQFSSSLNLIRSTPGRIEIANSSLSEFAVLGFELGLSWESPHRLVIWEAQFGDFFNGAQIIIDTFVGSGESKWLRQTGLVMSLPHGYEGGGPEHSSARVERFLQMCDEPEALPLTEELLGSGDTHTHNPNMHVAWPSTPAQQFHLLRRQQIRPYRKPLIIIGPKSLLKSPAATSEWEDMGHGTSFQPVIDDAVADPDAAEKVLLCSGKIYYELLAKRKELGRESTVAIVRLEELCPFPYAGLNHVIARYARPSPTFRFVQEEPENMGSWSWVSRRWARLARHSGILSETELEFVGRDASAAPATGIGKRYRAQQEKVVADAFK